MNGPARKLLFVEDDLGLQRQLRWSFSDYEVMTASDRSSLSGASTTAPGAEVYETYEVKAGDSLSKIAKRKLGDGNAWRKIFEANTDILKDPDKIYPGQKLKIPRS